MPIEPVKIPQNVYVEDRIIGPITLKQLFITGVGAGISYIVFSYVTKSGLGLPFKIGAWVPALIAAMFAFMKINDLSLFNIILLIVEGLNKPSQRYWSPSQGLSINIITRESKETLDAAQAKAIETARQLAAMTAEVEKRQKELNQITASEAVTPTPIVITSTPTREPENTPEMQAASPDASTNERGSSLPVRQGRISVQALTPSRSIDTICTDIPTYLGFHS